VGGAFDTIKEGLGDLITAEKMYLYLIDELTGEPVRGKGYPIVITTPAQVVPKMLPVMQVGMRAMSIYNGTAGIARAFGYPVPKVPKAWRDGARESIELLKQESSVEQFGVVHAEVKKAGEDTATVRGKSLRELQDFFAANDPGLKSGKQGDFAGLRRIGDPEEGTALWTTLSDPAQVSAAIEERARERRLEQREQEKTVAAAIQMKKSDVVAAAGVEPTAGVATRAVLTPGAESQPSGAMGADVLQQLQAVKQQLEQQLQQQQLERKQELEQQKQQHADVMQAFKDAPGCCVIA